MNRLVIGVVLLCALVVPALAQSANVKVINQSKWELHHMFVSSIGDNQWGPDQFEDNILAPGESFRLTKIPCDVYDIKVVDEDGDECVIDEVDLCRDNSSWRVTDSDLLQCEGYN